MRAESGAGRSVGADRGTAEKGIKRDHRSTATAAQNARIIEALRAGPKTTDDLRALGVYQPNARIWYLRARGFDITTELFDGYASDGYSHRRMARYRLLGEPEVGQ